MMTFPISRDIATHFILRPNFREAIERVRQSNWVLSHDGRGMFPLPVPQQAAVFRFGSADVVGSGLARNGLFARLAAGLGLHSQLRRPSRLGADGLNWRRWLDPAPIPSWAWGGEGKKGEWVGKRRSRPRGLIGLWGFRGEIWPASAARCVGACSAPWRFW